MAYRGGDLELRVPHGLAGREAAFAGDSGWLARAMESAGARTEAGSTIWVTPAVLTVLNRSYDLAVAHRAIEVRLEHLVHALTLIDDTALALERHGIRVATLRRESAAAIADHGPDGPANGRAEPYTSQELIETLRLAADSAYLRRSPTTTEDILAVLFDMKRETSSRTLLARHRSDWNINVAPEPRERVRVSAGSHIISESAMARAEPHTITDSFQNSRLDALERALRELAQDVTGERRLLGELLGEVQRNGAVRVEPPAPRSSTLDRLSALEQAILDSRAPPRAASPQSSEPATAPDAQDRISRIERSVEAKFSELARTWTLLGERLQSIEEMMLEERPQALAELPETLSRRLDGITHIDGKLKALELSLGAVLDQLGSLERRLDEPLRDADGNADRAALAARLGAIEQLLKVSGGSVSIDLDPIEGRLKEIEGRSGDAALYLEGFSERLDQIDSRIDAQQAGLAQTSATLGNELKALSAIMTAGRAQSERVEQLVSERVDGLLGAIERQRGEFQAVVSVPVQREMERVQALLTAQSEARQRELTAIGSALAAFGKRLETIDARVEAGLGDRLGQFMAGQATQIRELQESLMKVNANQQTIAASLDQWRTENAGDLGIISNRLTGIEAASRKPAEQLARLTDEIGVIGNILIQRQQQRSRFKMWLFGTEDWVGAGWRRRERQVQA